MRLFCLTLIASLMAMTPVVADTALIIANSRYDEAQNLRTADSFADLRAPLRRAGFGVERLENASIAEMREGLSELLNADPDGRLLIAFAGHALHSGRDTWLMGEDAVEDVDLAQVGGSGLSLDLVAEIAARAPGRAVILVGTEDRRMETGIGLSQGVSMPDLPQGVTLLTGTPRSLARFTREVLLSPGADLRAALAGTRDVAARGFVSAAVPFTPAAAEAAPEPPAPEPPPPEPEISSLEQALWDAALELGTIPAYRAYLDRYPDGAFVAEAEARIAALEDDPNLRAQQIEDALGLSRDDRRAIQRDLTILGFDTRGIDGIFGPGTRGAVANWQRATDQPETGFLTGRQIAALARQGGLRRAEIEAEEAAARAAEEAADRAWWRATGEGRDEPALRAYLDRYPDGLFAAVANERLSAILETRDRDAWAAATAIDTLRAYRGYLADWPDGLFADEAQRIIDARSGGGGRLTPEERAQAQAREAALNLSPVARSLIESRLAGLGLNPGAVDGVFDSDTRRAIRQYQRARGLDVTGYVERIMVVRLMAEVLGARIVE